MIAARRSPWRRAGAVALALVTTAAPAAAHGPESADPPVVPADSVVVVVLPLAGSLDAHIARALEARVADGLRRGSFAVVTADAVRSRGPAGECTPACVQQLGSATGARYLVRTDVTVEGRDYKIRLVLLRADTGEQAVTSAGLCEICGHEELGDRVGDMAAALRRKIGSAVEPPPRLRVLTRPDGSGVTLDGAAVGVTPLDITVAPGVHDVIVERPGFVAHRRRLTFTDGVTSTIAAELGPVRAASIPIDARRPARRLAPLGWASLVVGLGATGGGIALMVLDQRPILRDCDGENSDAMGRCKWRHHTLAGGVALTAVGVAAVTIGAILLGVDRRRSRRSRATVLVHPSGLGVRF